MAVGQTHICERLQLINEHRGRAAAGYITLLFKRKLHLDSILGTDVRNATSPVRYSISTSDLSLESFNFSIKLSEVYSF